MPIARTNHRRSIRMRTVLAAVLLPVFALTAACGYGSDKHSAKSAPAAASSGGTSGGTSASELRLGFFANVTHATPLVGLKEGFYAKELGSTKITPTVFNAGPAAIEALKGGSIDAAYLGPNPSISGFTSTNGQLLRIVAGTTSGGASLVVRGGINSPADLKGKKIADPQLGGTQDVALRTYLLNNGYHVDTSGSGDVSVVPTDNAQTLTSFQKGDLDGAWLPEPWATRLVQEGGGHVLVDEKTLWPNGQFDTTNLVVSQTFLKAHPDTVEALLRGQVATNDWIAANSDAAKADVNVQLGVYAGKPLAQKTLDAAWPNITVTNDPIASSLTTLEQNGVRSGVTKDADIHGLLDLAPLNKILAAAGKPAVSDAGLGVKQ